jgi:hypothetical protein
MNPHFLNDVERAAIIAFTSNEKMFGAVRKFVEYTIHHQGVSTPGDSTTDKNWVFSLVSAMDNNEKLGEMVRASAAGLGYLSAAFDEMKLLKVEEPKASKKNPAL